MTFTATIIHGEKEGRKLGYPTANLSIRRKDVGLSSGTYAVHIVIDGKEYEGAMNVKGRPWKCEVYVLDFEGDLYGKTATVVVFEKVNKWERLDTVHALKQKIADDVVRVRKAMEGQRNKKKKS